MSIPAPPPEVMVHYDSMKEYYIITIQRVAFVTYDKAKGFWSFGEDVPSNIDPNFPFIRKPAVIVSKSISAELVNSSELLLVDIILDLFKDVLEEHPDIKYWILKDKTLNKPIGSTVSWWDNVPNPCNLVVWNSTILNSKMDMKWTKPSANPPEPEEVKNLPGIMEDVVHPVTKRTEPLRSVIIDLNDWHRWSREQIADWLETLDIDLTFKTEEA